MNARDRIDEYITTHPKESLHLVCIGIILVWNSLSALLGILIYLIAKQTRIKWWIICAVGVPLGLCALLSQHYYYHVPMNSIEIIKDGWQANTIWWRALFSGNVRTSLTWLWGHERNYLLGVPPMLASVMSIINLIPTNHHATSLQDLHKGKLNKPHEISNRKMKQAIIRAMKAKQAGTLLGISKYNGAPIVIPDRDINQVMLILGTTGSGKTITMRRFYQRAISHGYPLLVVDGKPDDDNIAWLMQIAKRHDRKFYGFNCGNFQHYDPLSNGGYTELKDKLISLKDEWSSDHYRSIAEDYLQTAFAVLVKTGRPLSLKLVVQSLNYLKLISIAKTTKDEELIARAHSLKQYDARDITGLQAHLNILVNSELGEFFELGESAFNLIDVIKSGGMAYFALPALRFPSFSKVLGKLVINDIKAVIHRCTSQQRIFTVFDEFSVFAGEQVLNLVNMGRGKGVHAIFGTQGLADLDKVDISFRQQVLNCANTLLCHRLNDKDSVEAVAQWTGTQDKFNLTEQLDVHADYAKLGSVRVNKEFIIHPDWIKQELQTGEAFYISKVGRFRWDKVKVVINNY